LSEVEKPEQLLSANSLRDFEELEDREKVCTN
jgi:hypothetical protein